GLGIRRFLHSLRCSHYSWPLLSGNQFISLRIDISQGEIVSLAENFRKGLDPGQQSLAIATALKFRSHAQTHLANQTVRKTGSRRLAGLRKEFSAIGREQKQETLGRSCRRAYVPITGNCQRVIVDVFRADTLDRSNHEFKTR